MKDNEKENKTNVKKTSTVKKETRKIIRKYGHKRR